MTGSPSTRYAPTLLSPWRRRVQWATSLVILLLPWFHLSGESLLRIDIPHLSLHLLGQTLHIEELYLVLFFGIACVLLFLLTTLVLGRVWCGWLCPQTTLSDLAEWGARVVGLKVSHNRLHGPLWRKGLLQAGYLLLAFVVAANLLWYFIEPRRFFIELATGELHYAAWITLVLVMLLIYLDLAVVRRLMCRDFCPYGRFQTALVDRATLTLHLPDSEIARCIKCGACVRACPMEIDIRRGYQVECINCGRCLDACRTVMAKRDEPGLIGYSFGYEGVGAKGLLNPRTLLLSLATLVISAVLLVSILNRTTVSLKVAVSHTVSARQLDAGQQGTFFNAWLNNRGAQSLDCTLLALRRDSGAALLLKGPHQALLKPGENRRLDFVLLTPADERVEVVFRLIAADGVELSTAEAYIKPMEKETTR